MSSKQSREVLYIVAFLLTSVGLFTMLVVLAILTVPLQNVPTSSTIHSPTPSLVRATVKPGSTPNRGTGGPQGGWHPSAQAQATMTAYYKEPPPWKFFTDMLTPPPSITPVWSSASGTFPPGCGRFPHGNNFLMIRQGTPEDLKFGVKYDLTDDASIAVYSCDSDWGYILMINLLNSIP